MIKILFLIDSLGNGGAERALYNLAMNLDLTKYEIHIKTLYDTGIYKEKLKDCINYTSAKFIPIPGINYFLKLIPAALLHKLLIREKYDLEIAFLEGPCTKIISGAEKKIKTAAFVRIDIKEHIHAKKCYISYKSMKKSYLTFNKIAFVGHDALEIFSDYIGITQNLCVVQNIVEDEVIRLKSKERIEDFKYDTSHPLFVSVGRLHYQKGYDLLIKVHDKLIKSGYKHTILIIGSGPEEETLNELIRKYNVEKTFLLYGYDENPFKFISIADWFVCSSRFEGFSSAIREAIILHKPIVTTKVSGTNELFKDNSNGILCEFDEDELFDSMKKVLSQIELKEFYEKKSIELSKRYTKKVTIENNELFIKRLLD